MQIAYKDKQNTKVSAERILFSFMQILKFKGKHDTE